MSYHFYDTHPENGRSIAVLVDDESIYAVYEDDNDVFLMVNAEEEDMREAAIAEFGEEFVSDRFHQFDEN